MTFFEDKRRKAAISIFLTIILIPTMLLSAVLIDGSRVAGAKAIVQEASDLAAVSALADYDLDLKEQFGMFAVRDPGKLEEIYKKSLEATLMSYGLDDAEYSEMIWNYMKTSITGSASYQGASFLNLYDFQTEETKVEPLYPLKEKDVLKTQMVEYSKFRGIFVALDRLELLKNLGTAQKQAAENEKTAGVMESKMGIDESNSSADQAIKDLHEDIVALMDSTRAFEDVRNRYFTALGAKMEILRHDHMIPEEEDDPDPEDRRNASQYEDLKEDLSAAAANIRIQAAEVLRQARTAREEAEKAVERLKGFQEDHAGGTGAVQEMVEDAGQSRADYQSYIEQTEKILEDDILDYYANEFASDRLESVLSQIEEAIHKDEERISEEQERFEEEQDDPEAEYTNDQYFYYYLDSETRVEDRDAAIRYSYRPAIDKIVNKGRISLDALRRVPWKDIQTAGYGKSTEQQVIDEDFAKQQSEKNTDGGGDDSQGAPRGEIEENVYSALPSREKGYGADQEKKAKNGFYNKDGDLGNSRDILSQGSRSMILDMAESARDDILCYTYMFGTFKTRMTGVEKFSGDHMSQEDKNSFYMPAWRYAHPEGELDMRFSPKKDRKTKLRSEIEYLIFGMRTDAANEAAVYAAIYLERMANNMIAIYMVPSVKGACHATAAGASALTLGIVPEPVFFWIFLTAWAAAETFIEMDYLISGGYKVPLIKTSQNVLLRLNPSAAAAGGLINNYGEEGLFVSYEDYLLILLVLKGDTKRILRSADLIEVNMKENGRSDFTMSKAYTYIRADTGVSMSHLFGDVMPFQSEYEKQGQTGRLRFTSSIYLGY